MQCIQMKGLQNDVIFLLLMPWLPSVLAKCIFDEVQSSIRVLSPAAIHPNLSDWTLNEVSRKQDASKQDQLTHNDHQNEKSHHSQSHRSKRMPENRMKASEPEPIRITTWTARESPVLSHREMQRLEAAVGDAVSTVSKFLSVTKVQRRLLLNRDITKYCRFIWRNSSSANFNKCGRANEKYQSEICLGVTIPDEHLIGCAFYPHPDQPVLKVIKSNGTGVSDTDFLLYVHTQITDKCKADPSVRAYSAHCQTDSEGRPVAGVMVFCREQLSLTGYSHERMVQTVIHELVHVLGFSKELFSTWTNCSPFSQGGCSHGQVIYKDEFGQMRIYSSKVMKALHTHLNSTHTELGVPLENQDADSQGVSSHWEARLLQGSIMAAVLAEPPLVRIDAITLSALQDTGWYLVNLSQAQDLLWGKDEGALFGSLSTCKKSSAFFCVGSGQGCHYLHLHKGVCQSDQYLEGCRIYKPLANASECWKAENESGSEMEIWSGEIYHSDSRCFCSSLIRENQSFLRGSVSGRCYRHRCTGWNRYQIQVLGSDWLDCPAGQNIEVFGYRGAVFCPEKKFCHYHDVAPFITVHKPLRTILLPTEPPSSDLIVTQIHMTSRPRLNFSTACIFSAGRLEVTVAALVGGTAVIFLLVYLIAFWRKCSSSRLRVHVLI